MPKITYEGRTYNSRSDETVLDTLIRQATDNIQFSCRSGICKVCMIRCREGNVSEESRQDLDPDLQAKGYFLPCKCLPQNDLVLAPPVDAELFGTTIVIEKTMLAPDICKLLVEPVSDKNTRPGQFFNLKRKDGLTRSYSLANRAKEDYFLEFHIKRMPGGEMSNWIFDQLQAGDDLEIRGPQGDCYYQGLKDMNMLLIGTGTGLAPLLGVIREALANQHQGKIYLYHGSRHRNGLYLENELQALAQQHNNFHYIPCLSSDEVTGNYKHGRVHEIACSERTELEDWQVYLAGNPQMVDAAIMQAKKQGASPSDIHSDPFELKDKRQQERAETDIPSPDTLNEKKVIPPDPKTWEALDDGVLLSQVLNDFYAQVYKDEKLAPFFQHATVGRSIEKQFSFIKSTLLGDGSYFGDRPRNAHHWMVISNELFDYREDLLQDTMLKHGVRPEIAKKIRELDELFRSDIVKDKPWHRYLNGIALPLDGYAEEELTHGTLCDGCEKELSPGQKVKYHLRLGKVFCNDCTALDTPHLTDNG